MWRLDGRSAANLLNRCQFSGFGFGGQAIRSLARRAPDGFAGSFVKGEEGVGVFAIKRDRRGD